MKTIKPSLAWLLAFTAAFAVLAGFVFWGTWSCDVTPIMPDCPTVHPVGYFAALSKCLGERCLETWQFVPDDLTVFIGTPYFRQELQYAFGAYFAALALAYYCRGRGLSRAASYSAALLLGFCGYWFSLFSAGHLGWFLLMIYCVFAFGLADRAVRKGKLKNWLLLGAVVAWGCRRQQDLWMVFTFFAAAYFVWCCVRERKWPDLKGVACAALAFFVIGGANIRSAFTEALAGRERQLEESKGSALSGGEGKSDEEAKWIFVTNWSMPPEDTLEFFVPRVHGDTSCPLSLSLAAARHADLKPYTGRLGRPLGAPEGNYRQHSLYVGWVTCLLALVAIAGAVRNRRDIPSDLVFFAGAALFFWLLSMGRYCEFVYRGVFQVPLINSLRAPVKWHHATELSLCVLAACGVEALWRAPWVKARRWARWAVLGFVLLGAFDLARVNHIYCVPVDLRAVRRQDCNMDLTILREADLRHPQVAAMVRARQIIPLANYAGRRDVWLVEYLTPRKPPEKKPGPPPLAKGLGIVSLLGTLAVAAYGIKKS